MKVNFYQDSSFLRTPQKTNPYFDPIIKVCEQNGIEWDVIFPSRPMVCGYPENHIVVSWLLWRGATWFWRVVHMFRKLPVWRIQRLFGRLMRPLIGKRLAADVHVSVGGNAIFPLYGMFPNVRQVDVQHGVIYSAHPGYFSRDGRIWPVYRRGEFDRREFWVYGQGYADCFFRNRENVKDLEGRVKVIGDVVRAGKANVDAADIGGTGRLRDVIAFSAQLTYDLDAGTLVEMVRRMVAFFEELHVTHGSAYRYVFKQHPRFDNCCDISALTALSFVEFSDKPWTDLYPQMALHVTFSSTVTFDAASAGVPTYHPPYSENKILDGRFYGTDFNYPFAEKTAEALLSLMKDDTAATVKTTHDWFLSCYAPFDEKNCLSLIRGKE